MSEPIDPQPPGDRPSHFGGSIEQTLAGRAELDVGEVLRESWERIDGIKSIVNAGFGVTYAVVFVVAGLLGPIFGLNEENLYTGWISQLVVMIIVYPFMAGVFMLGLKRSVGMPVTFAEQFSQYGRLAPILAVGLLQSFATFVGTMLFILPGLYLAVALSLAIPLKVEKDLPVVDCLVVSLKLVNRRFLAVLALGLVSAGLMIIGMLSLIGWIWTLPWTVMIYSVLYRQLAGFDVDAGARALATREY
ncbi:MAG: hypothetical protein R3E86_20195 [Pseudomonadales bacterium]